MEQVSLNALIIVATTLFFISISAESESEVSRPRISRKLIPNYLYGIGIYELNKGFYSGDQLSYALAIVSLFGSVYMFLENG